MENGYGRGESEGWRKTKSNRVMVHLADDEDGTERIWRNFAADMNRSSWRDIVKRHLSMSLPQFTIRTWMGRFQQNNTPEISSNTPNKIITGTNEA